MEQSYDDINLEIFNTVKSELMNAAEEFLYSDKTSSTGEKTDRLLRLVNKQYDI